MFQETVKKQVVAVYFVSVSVLMHFFLLETLDIGIWITYRHLFALLLVFSAFISFLLFLIFLTSLIDFRVLLVCRS